jgi:hypothetical protein
MRIKVFCKANTYLIKISKGSFVEIPGNNDELPETVLSDSKDLDINEFENQRTT